MDNKIRKVVRGLLNQLNCYFPVAEYIFMILEQVEKMPEGVDPSYYFLTDGVRMYINSDKMQKNEALEPDTTKMEEELFHELLHVYLGHPAMADIWTRDAEYDRKCDREVESWWKDYCWEIKKWEYLPLLRSEEEEQIGFLKHDIWYMQGQNSSGSSGMRQNSMDPKEVWDQLQQLQVKGIIKQQQGMYGEISKKGMKNDMKHSGEPVDYLDVLKEYVEVKEQEKVTDEMFDMVMYSYSREIYEKAILLEPVEEMDTLVASFYMAIDISGSCQGELVEKFIDETQNVLQELCGRRNRKIDIYLFLCDCRIQKEFHITSVEAFSDIEKFMEWGDGTSFIPVFDRVQELMQSEPKTHTALFYYTDGFGEFPEEKPDLDVYFLMQQKDIEYFEGPKWITTIDIG